MPSYQSLCFLSSSPQPIASSLATTLTRRCKRDVAAVAKEKWLTRRISLSVPLLFLPDDDYVVCSPMQGNGRNTMGTNMTADPS